MSQATILVADDDASIRLVMSQTLLQEGYKVRATDSAEALLKWIKAGEGDVVVTDVYMGEGSIFDRLPEVKRMRPDLPVIVISARNTILTATAALEHGALDYLPKPFRIDALAEKVARALERAPVRDRVERQRRQSQRDADLPLMGRSTAMQEVYRVISRVMNTDLPVLLVGETGTGKARAARVIHDLSRRRERPFLEVDDLLSAPGMGRDSERSEAILAMADGGTLFVDDLTSLTRESQARLLKLLDTIEAKEDQPGANVARLVACISETALNELPGAGLREDLYYRVNVIAIRLPPLRERREDIPDLASALMEARSSGREQVRRFEPAALSVLADQDWPGNVRELDNVVARLVALAPHDVLSARDVVQHLGISATGSSQGEENLEAAFENALARHIQPRLAALRDGEDSSVHEDAVQALERPLIAMTLRLTQGNKLRAAALLGMNRNTLRARMRILGLDSDDSSVNDSSS